MMPLAEEVKSEIRDMERLGVISNAAAERACRLVDEDPDILDGAISVTDAADLAASLAAV